MGQWSSRIEQFDREDGRPSSRRAVAPSYKLLGALLSGSADKAKAELADIGSSGTLVSKSAAEELLTYAAGNPRAFDEAAELLKASLTFDFGLAGLGRTWAMDILRARNNSQWAAALAISGQTDISAQEDVLKILQPSECLVARTIRARLLVSQEEYAQAERIYRSLAEAEPGNAEILLNLAIVTEKTEALPKALELYRAVWQMRKDPVAANNAAYVTTRLSPADAAALAEAQGWTEAAVQGAPGVPAFRDTKGWVAHLQGRTDEALLELRRAVKGLPDSPEVHYHLGRVEMVAKNKQLARWHLEAAVAIGQRLEAEGREIAPDIGEAIALAKECLAQME